jgi:hypothetical protein
MNKWLMTSTMAAGALVAVLSGAAFAEERERLRAQDVRKALLGFEMSGVHNASGATWTECIEPSGVTRYLFRGEESVGRVQIEPNARACFTYAGDGHARRHCFFLERVNGQLRFVEDAQNPTIYRVLQTTPVTSCQGREAIS